MPAPGKFLALILPAQPVPARRRWLGSGLYWTAQLALWVPLAVGTDLFLIVTRQAEFGWFALFSSLAFALEMIVGTHLSRGLLLGLCRRARPARHYLLAGLGCVLLCAVVAMTIGRTLAHLTLPTAALTGLEELANSLLLAYLGAEYSTFWIAGFLSLLFLRALHAADHARLQADTSAKQAELLALKAQINPHFLFNSLNTLRALLPREQRTPREAITMLADLLRAALDVQNHRTIPLGRELETVDAYLALEQLRFEERLRVVREIEPAALAAAVPPFALQTLVENAVKFGVAPRAEGGEIRLGATLLAGTLRIRISNPGRLGPTPTGSTGLGLANLRRRLAHLHGDVARLEVREEAPDLVVAELTLPASTP